MAAGSGILRRGRGDGAKVGRLGRGSATATGVLDRLRSLRSHPVEELAAEIGGAAEDARHLGAGRVLDVDDVALAHAERVDDVTLEPLGVGVGGDDIRDVLRQPAIVGSWVSPRPCLMK